jgi:hypothetical protein
MAGVYDDENPNKEFEEIISGYSPVTIPASVFNEPKQSSDAFSQAQKMVDMPVILGTTPLDADVRSVFDTRPINGFDTIFVSDGEITTPESAIQTYTFSVPENYIVVIRGVKFVANEMPVALLDPTLVKMSLLVNGGTVPNYINIPEVIYGHWIPAHVIAGVNQTFGAVLNINPDIFPAGFTLTAMFHCNLLLATGQPANMEIANPKPVKPTPAPQTTPTPQQYVNPNTGGAFKYANLNNKKSGSQNPKSKRWGR